MRRLLLFALMLSVFLLSGCSSTSAPDQTVKGMLGDLYFGQGSYEDYQSYFLDPAHVASKTEFDKIRNLGAKNVFPNAKNTDALSNQLATFRKDDKNVVVYLVDFQLDKTRDMHWNLVNTDKGWKIIN